MKNIYDIVENSPYHNEEFYVRLLAALDGIKKAVIITEGNPDFDRYDFITNKDDEENLEELERFVEWLDRKRSIGLDFYDECYYEGKHLDECYKEFKNTTSQTRKTKLVH